MGEWFRTGDNTVTFTYALILAGHCARFDPDYEYRIVKYEKRYWVERRLINSQQVMLWEYAR